MQLVRPFMKSEIRKMVSVTIIYEESFSVKVISIFWFRFILTVQTPPLSLTLCPRTFCQSIMEEKLGMLRTLRNGGWTKLWSIASTLWMKADGLWMKPKGLETITTRRKRCLEWKGVLGPWQ